MISIDVLCKQILRRMVDVIIRESSHCEVAVVIIRLESEVDTFLLPNLLGGSNEILRKELFLFVEVVAGALRLSASIRR